jgi:hypothetical protein
MIKHIFIKSIACVLLCNILFIQGCKDARVKEVASLYTEVMAIHDEVMPATATIHESKKQLKTLLDTSSDSTAVFGVLKTLDTADESMMVWMDEFNPQYDALPLDQQITYLKEEKNRIIKVRDNIKGALGQADKLLKK